MISKVFQIIAAIILIVLGKFIVAEELRPEFIGAGCIFFITFFFTVLEDGIRNFKRLKLSWQIFILRVQGKKIRFSMSYLYLINVDGQYLLVKNTNFGHYQLVGGKYKRLEGTQQFLKNTFNATEDIKLPEKLLMKDDFALFIPANKAISFIDWFNKGKDREINHWREFYEELIDGKGKLLSKKNFPYINYNFKGRVTTPIKKSKGWDCYEVLQYDILELLPNIEQMNELKELKSKGDSDYVKWADHELIQNLGYDKRSREKLYIIGQHTKWAINQKWSREE
ncbi:SMODS-associated NUDIX domain-containing protein [Tenacibaculum xiamenense]|uniref:SMODS-associated NUDIX domain-containing protein n=1 Tax=Tenacibaculum xiamenense TaxID=1261553 RepID=UPI003894A287